MLSGVERAADARFIARFLYSAKCGFSSPPADFACNGVKAQSNTTDISCADDTAASGGDEILRLLYFSSPSRAADCRIAHYSFECNEMKLCERCSPLFECDRKSAGRRHLYFITTSCLDITIDFSSMTAAIFGHMMPMPCAIANSTEYCFRRRLYSSRLK